MQKIVAISSVLLLGACGTESPPLSVPASFISSTPPADIGQDAQAAGLPEAAMFAWQHFIALSWPAKAGVRGVADDARSFGDTGAVVWETMRNKVEVFPGTGDDPPGFHSDADKHYGYHALPPQYLYADGAIPPCAGQAVPAQPAWMNLDELNQLFINDLFAGAAPKKSARNATPRLVRYNVKVNDVAFAYVVEPGSSLWKQGASYTNATKNYLAVAGSNGRITTLPGPVIAFPAGALALKSSWRELTDAEQRSGRFYQTTARYYEVLDPNMRTACYREAAWGLVGLHVMAKTPTAPSWVFATFEQADTLLTQAGQAVEDEDGNMIASPKTPMPWSPQPTYADGATPAVSVGGQPYCTTPGARLYFHEIAIGFAGVQQTGIPTGGNICINQRAQAIPSGVTAANRAAHDAMKRYFLENDITSSPWFYYKLVNVQWRPFDVSEIDAKDSHSDDNAATYYTSNITIESDYTLQLFSGTLTTNGAATQLPANFDRFGAKRATHANVLTFDGSGRLQNTYTMGGCMGCHGDAAVLHGTDASYLLASGQTLAPGTPDL